MQGGDISNTSPMTLMVHLDCLTNVEQETIKSKFLRRETTTETRTLDVRLANHFYREAQKLDGVTFVCFTTDGSDLKHWEDRLERLNINPFRYFENYSSPQRLLEEIPYMPRLVGIIDIPGRALVWGSKYMDSNRLTRL